MAPVETIFAILMILVGGSQWLPAEQSYSVVESARAADDIIVSLEHARHFVSGVWRTQSQSQGSSSNDSGSHSVRVYFYSTLV